MVATHTTVEVVAAPPTATASGQLDHLHPSHSMSHTSFLEVGHMHDNHYIHVRWIEKKCSIRLLALLPSSTCAHILCVDAHILGIFGTMAHYHISMGLVLLIIENFKNRASIFGMSICMTSSTPKIFVILLPLLDVL